MRYVSSLFIVLLISMSAVHSQELTSAEEYSQRGITRFQTNDLDGAIADFTKVIEMNGQNLEFCYYFRGMAHYRKGKPDQAIADLSKAIAIKGDPRFYDDRGNLLARQGELEQAMADLNKAIEIAPQYAKAYGDRGIVRLMRGEDAAAETDFSKCFALDGALETQFRTAANKLKQRGVSDYKHEEPSDIEVLKFSWTATPAKVLIVPSSPAIEVSSTPVSATGTRVLADPNAKNQPGPAEITDPSGTSLPPHHSPSNTRDIVDYKFTALIKNAGNKTIVAVKWAYFFDPKDLAHEKLAYLFVSKTEIKPGKEKSLNDSLSSGGGPKSPIKLPNKQNAALYSERIAILRLDYADGSSWENSGASTGPPKTARH